MPRFRVRIGEGDTPEMYCLKCRDWWPITMEYWPSRERFWECRACRNEAARLRMAKRYADPEGRLEAINRSRIYRAYVKDTEPELLDVIKTERRLRVNEDQNQRRIRHRQVNREYMRRYRAAKKAEKAA